MYFNVLEPTLKFVYYTTLRNVYVCVLNGNILHTKTVIKYSIIEKFTCILVKNNVII